MEESEEDEIASESGSESVESASDGERRES
jgi:hypothetical protein